MERLARKAGCDRDPALATRARPGSGNLPMSADARGQSRAAILTDREAEAKP
jgi:hypothetical protein